MKHLVTIFDFINAFSKGILQHILLFANSDQKISNFDIGVFDIRKLN